MDELRRDIDSLQSEISRLNREKTEDRKRIRSLEHALGKENTVNLLIDGTKSFVQAVAATTGPVISTISSQIMCMITNRPKKKRRVRTSVRTGAPFL